MSMNIYFNDSDEYECQQQKHKCFHDFNSNDDCVVVRDKMMFIVTRNSALKRRNALYTPYVHERIHTNPNS